LMMFAFLAGSCLGVRGVKAAEVRVGWSIGTFATAAVVWLAALFWLVIPTIAAEALAQEADEDIVNSVPSPQAPFDEVAAHKVLVAAGKYMDAFTLHQPLNAEYAERAAETLAMAGADRSQLMDALDKTIAANPMSINAYLTRASLEAQAGDADAAMKDMTTAIDINPTEVSMRVQYGDLLMSLRRFDDAIGQYEEALKFNDLLPIEEPKRVNDAAIRLKYARALIAAGKKVEARGQLRLALIDNNSLASDDPRRLDPEQLDEIRKLMQ